MREAIASVAAMGIRGKRDVSLAQHVLPDDFSPP